MALRPALRGLVSGPGKMLARELRDSMRGAGVVERWAEVRGVGSGAAPRGGEEMEKSDRAWAGV